MKFHFLSRIDQSKIKFIDHENTFLASTNIAEAKSKTIPQSVGPCTPPTKEESTFLNQSPFARSMKSSGSGQDPHTSISQYMPESSINRIKVEIRCCDVGIGHVWIIFNSFNPQMEPDLLIEGFLTSLDYDPQVLKSSEGFLDYVSRLANDYSRNQFQNFFKSTLFAATNASQVTERIYEQLQNIYLCQNIVYQFIQRGETLTLYLPLKVASKANGHDGIAYLTFRWILNPGSGLDHFDYSMQWPEDTPILPIPDFNISKSSILEYHAKLQVLINGKQAKLVSSKTLRRQLLLMIQNKFQKYVLDLDSESFSSISLYIFFSAGDDILGASVVNVHTTNFPEELPTIVLSSPLFFDSLESSTPASKVFSFGTLIDPANVDEIVNKLE